MGALTAILVGLLFLGCEGRPDGAPLSACSSLTPRHSGISPQRDGPPYTISVSKHGNKVRVKLSSSVGEEFQGFVLQARSSRDRTKIVDGHFTTKDDVTKTIDCFNGRENTLTMTSPAPKLEVVTDWTPNTAMDETVIFRATIAKTFALFWTEIDSTPVKIKSDGPSGGSSSERKQANSNKIYDDCSVSKGCFGIPGGCINNQDCQVLASYSKSKDGILFQMHGTLADNAYMALGLSRDQLMGDDSVTECVLRGSRITARRSWNEGKSNQFLNELSGGDYDSKLEDDLSMCSFTMAYITQSNGRSFNLANNTYYILLATGPMRNERLSYHSIRASTQQAVNFSAFTVSEAEGVTDAVKIHGKTEESFMSNFTESDSFTTEATIDMSPSSKSSGSESYENNGAYLGLSLSLGLAIFGLQVLLQAGRH